ARLRVAVAARRALRVRAALGPRRDASGVRAAILIAGVAAGRVAVGIEPVLVVEEVATTRCEEEERERRHQNALHRTRLHSARAMSGPGASARVECFRRVSLAAAGSVNIASQTACIYALAIMKPPEGSAGFAPVRCCVPPSGVVDGANGLFEGV